MGGLCCRDGRNHRQNQYQDPSLPATATATTTSFNTANHVDSNTNTDTNNLTQNNPRPNNPIPSSYSLISPIASLPSPSPSPPPSHGFAANASYLPSASPPTINPASYNSYNYPPSPPPPPFYPLFGGWTPHHSANISRPQLPVRPAQVPPPYVDHNHAKTIKNDVNVHKDSIRVFVDDKNLDAHLVSFTFDALVDGSITIFYLAKEGANCTFIPLYPDIYMPRKIPFKKGLGQKFSQPSGTGIDLGFFELDHLSKPSQEEDIFPLVISAEACLPSLSMGAEPDQPLPTMSHRAQITQAVLEKNNEGHFQVKVVKQILWIDGVHYELREIYGIGNSEAPGFDDRDPGKECVICMTEPKDTAVLPCRHMCLCSGCAKELRLQSDKCPICRQPIRELIEIKINKDHPSV